MTLGRAKQQKWLAAGAAGSLGCLVIAGMVVMLPIQPSNVQTLAATTAAPPSTTAPTKTPGTVAKAAHVVKELHHAATASAPALSRAAATPSVATTATSTPAPARPTAAVNTPAPRSATRAATTPTVRVTPTTTAPRPAASSPAATTVARTQPSTAAVDQAIVGLQSYVHSPISPTVAEVATLGNDVCSAFDQGSTSAQVQAAVAQKLAGIPFTTVLPGASYYVVSTAVSLYCPGYASKVG